MHPRIDQKIVVVTRPTQLAALRRKHNTAAQAKFKLVSAKRRELESSSKFRGQDLDRLAEAAYREVDLAASVYDQAVGQIREDLDFTDFDLPVQMVDRDFLPNFVFGKHDIIVTIGQDGLVANTAKYAVGMPIVAVNPDPKRIDGVLLPFRTDQARAAVRAVLQGTAKMRQVTLAEAVLADGQRLLAFNELFIGSRTHVSARYRLNVDGKTEPQSSSGLLVCTGAGSTGWLSSVFNMASGIARMFAGAGEGKAPAPGGSIRLGWEDPRLVYVVREPFVSKGSAANLVSGMVDPGKEIIVESDMASNGVIFSDGVENDFLEFNAGATAHVRAAAGKAMLVVG